MTVPRMPPSGIDHYRKRKGLTQDGLAAKVGIERSRLSRIETGAEIPSAAEVDRFVEALEVPPTYLFSRHILAEIAERSREPV